MSSIMPLCLTAQLGPLSFTGTSKGGDIVGLLAEIETFDNTGVVLRSGSAAPPPRGHNVGGRVDALQPHIVRPEA